MAEKAIADSKKLLASTGPKGSSSIATKSGRAVSQKEKPAAPAAPKAPSSGMIGDQGADSASGIKTNVDNVAQYIKGVPKMHKGGVVKEDGLKNLQEGEVVIPKEKAEEGKKVMELKKKAGPMAKAMEEEESEPKSEEKKETKKEEKAEGKHKTSDKTSPEKESKAKKHNFHRTEIVHHKNGSHTVTHHPHPAKPSSDGKPVEQEEPMSYAAPDMASMQQGMEQNLGGGPQGGGQPSAAAPAAEAAPAQA